MGKATAILALACLAGCSTIDYSRPPPPDFPKLEPIIHLVGADVIQKKCGSFWEPLFGGAVACAELSFAYGVCHIWTMFDAQWIIEHEKAHCAGYRHFD